MTKLKMTGHTPLSRSFITTVTLCTLVIGLIQTYPQYAFAQSTGAETGDAQIDAEKSKLEKNSKPSKKQRLGKFLKEKGAAVGRGAGYLSSGVTIATVGAVTAVGGFAGGTAKGLVYGIAGKKHERSKDINQMPSATEDIATVGETVGAAGGGIISGVALLNPFTAVTGSISGLSLLACHQLKAVKADEKTTDENLSSDSASASSTDDSESRVAKEADSTGSVEVAEKEANSYCERQTRLAEQAKKVVTKTTMMSSDTGSKVGGWTGEKARSLAGYIAKPFQRGKNSKTESSADKGE